MGLASYVRSVAGEELRYQRATDAVQGKEKEIDASARALAATLSWLPRTQSSHTFSKRCQALATALRILQSRVETAF
ncbi:MAG TPA: hypothetical protein VFF64_27195, partial [Candidatus Eremiobacteraceae bacterium]|nr:hypothetical protein [Candidatus Eremiobacteraceae bacterium]